MYALYMPERVKTRPCESVKKKMNFIVSLPHEIFATIILLPLFEKLNLKLQNCQYVSGDRQRIELELFNKNLSDTTFDLQKRKEIACIMTLNKGKEQFNVEHTTVEDRNAANI